VAAGLADLDRDERGDLIAERRRIHLGPEREQARAGTSEMMSK
jgi:hypothetical protein